MSVFEQPLTPLWTRPVAAGGTTIFCDPRLPSARRPTGVATMVPASMPALRNETTPPDWAWLDAAVRSWQVEDRRPGGPTERYARYLGWCEVMTPAQDPLALAVAFFTARTALPPDAEQWQGLRALVGLPKQPNPYDVALAWAAGWRNDALVVPGRRGVPGLPGLVAVA